MRSSQIEKRALQTVVAVAALTPLLIGLTGVISGPDFLKLSYPWPADLDSHFRFYSGIFVAIGLGWYSCIPGIELKGPRFRMLAALTFAGGLARLFSLITVGLPSMGHRAGLAMELIVVPLLVLWQARIETKAHER
jgi:hypothetical protein